MNPSTRRHFFFSAGSALTALQAIRVMGANDRIQIGIVGLGGRGRAHVSGYASLSECSITAMCDVNQASLERGMAQAEKLTGVKPKGYVDMKEVFAAKDVDAVSMPLPNHWHALATIWACQAGKDVYIEKPACHNVWEGLRMVDAARKYKRMVQIGSQGRSMPHKIKAMQLLHDGAIGKVYMAKGLCFKRRKSIGKTPTGPVPLGVDWDKFLGPAPMRAFSQNRFTYNWHWFWDTGNGDIGNQGIHEMDIARWGLGRTGLPTRVVSTGGKYVYDDDQETPNTQLATLQYDDAEVVFEVRGILTGGEGGLGREGGGNVVGDLFYGGDGWMAVDGRGFQMYKGESSEKALEEKASGKDTADHMRNFLGAVKSRNYKELNADVEIGVMSAALVHLSNISYRLGRRLTFDPVKMTFPGDAEATKMLTREYRKPYVVPEKV
jgi:predicted dehydrogenase